MYLFLDVDGVLNTTEDWKRKLYSLNPTCVAAFCELLGHIEDPKIVLSSTWRNGIARDQSTPVHIGNLLDALASAGITTLDKTGTSPDGSREKEIDHYLRRHEPDSYLILDDDPAMFDHKEKTNRLYLVDSKTGLTIRDVKKIRKSFL